MDEVVRVCANGCEGVKIGDSRIKNMNIEKIMRRLDEEGILVLDKGKNRKRVERHYTDDFGCEYQVSWESSTDGAPFIDDGWERDDIEELVLMSIEDGYEILE